MIRIANAGGYWGDDPAALRRQVLDGPSPDVIGIDYLAEVTMSILQKQRQRDPAAGYARDFVAQLEPLLPEILARRIRIITNAGGVNPAACAEAVAGLARARGLNLRIALVEGDDITERVEALRAEGINFRNMDTGESLGSAQVLSAHAYFGALPLVEALRADPDIVLCGRVTDTGLTLAPLVHAFGWAWDDWDRLAGGIVAGHLLECGAQATGGNFTDWRKVPSFLELGYPIAEAEADGSFVLTKHPGSGGLVTRATAREQLLYEMGHPRSYLTPDVIADFTSIQLSADGPNRVRVHGMRGRPPTDLLKASLALADGFKVSGSLIISGPGARAKAEAFADILWTRCRRELVRADLPHLDDTCTEFVGDDATHRGLTPHHEPSEILLRLSAQAETRAPLEVFRKLLPALILSGPPGVAVTGGAPVISDIVSYWPALIPQASAQPRVRILEERGTGRLEEVSLTRLEWPVTGGNPSDPGPPEDPWDWEDEGGPKVRVPLLKIAHARSGDKGDTANIGLLGRSPQCYAWLRDQVTAERVKTWFASICLGKVVRHTVPSLWALNFLLEEALGGGGTRSLFLDAQGKTLAQALLRCEVEIPESLLATIDADNLADGGWS
jgi:hypothetical protein